jgi:hypothetical protein
MKHLNDVIEQFLKSDQSLRSGPHLGGEPRKVTKEQVAFLIEQLKIASRQNSRIVAVLVVLYAAMLIGGFVIVFTLFHEPKAMRAALGGSFLSLLVIVKGLHSVWREQNGMNMMLSLLPSLSPQEAVKVVETHYYKTKNLARQSN